jgi:hypothetical protein
MLERWYDDHSCVHHPLNCVHTHDTDGDTGGALRPRYDEPSRPARLQTAACACGRTSWPAAPGPTTSLQSSPSCFLLPAGGLLARSLGYSPRSRPVLLFYYPSAAKPTHPLPAAPSPCSRKSANSPRENPASAPGPGSLIRPPARRRRLLLLREFGKRRASLEESTSFFRPRPAGPFS